MVRRGGQVNSATSEFFINLSDNTNLDSVDEGFTVFGQVAGTDMPTVDTIGNLFRVVGRWTLNSALHETFGELPVHLSPIEPASGYGCFDLQETRDTELSDWLRALVNLSETALESDPLTGPLYFLSNTCTCTCAGAVAPPSVPCTTNRSVAYFDNGWFVVPTPMTCDRVAESEESLAARRNDQQPQIGVELVEVTTVLVPEPSAGLMLAAGLMGLFSLAGFRNSPKAMR